MFQDEPLGYDTTPFETPEEAWFWFIAAYAARNEGARIIAGAGLTPRACEPLDILKIIDRLHRNRVLLRDHLLVLRHYGRRAFAPDPKHPKEIRAAALWDEAMAHLEVALRRKGLMQTNVCSFPRQTSHGEGAHA
ncbi:MAG: hypothetical protein AB7E85_02030 [Pseudobdellovibrionaceae bacterium]